MNSDSGRQRNDDSFFSNLMVRPVAFGFNDETAVNNAFQKQGEEDNIPELARKESDAFNEADYPGFGLYRRKRRRFRKMHACGNILSVTHR